MEERLKLKSNQIKVGVQGAKPPKAPRILRFSKPETALS